MRGEQDADGGPDEQQLEGGDEIEEAEGEVEDAEAGDEAGEGGADDADGEVDEEAEPERPQRHVARRPSREERATRRENAELKERLDRLERDRSAPTPADPQAAARADAELMERLRLMDPVDALAEVRRIERENIGRYVSGVETRIMDRVDKQEFDREARTSPARQRLASEVERYIADARRQGNSQVTRETVFHLLYGQEMDRKARDVAPRQQRQAQRRVAAATTRPGAARGDAVRGRRDSMDADERLLRNTTLGDI
jgi:hypothetical protein